MLAPREPVSLGLEVHCEWRQEAETQILLPSVGEPVFGLPMDLFQGFVRWHLIEGEGNIHPFAQGGRGTGDGQRDHPPLCFAANHKKLLCKLLIQVGGVILFPSLSWDCFWVASSG